jgi:ceramide glucosyltransferase
MDVLTAVATTGLGIASAAHVASIALAMRRVAKGRSRPSARPPAGVSILRPVCGLEPSIEATLASSFQVDHPSYEVIFCVAAADDPVVPIVRRLIREHPEVPARLLVGGTSGGPNPKLDNLLKAWDVASHDWVVLVDSNVLLPGDCLDRLFARWTERCAFVCSPPVGIDVQGCAAELEAAFLNTLEARWQLAADELGLAFVQGKTILLRRSELDREGGLVALAREVAEDAAATKIARRRGREVHLVDAPFPQPLGRRSFTGVWRRQLRWAQLRRLSFPRLFCAELPAGGMLPFALAGYLATVGVLPWAGVGGMMLAWYAAEALLARSFGWPLRACAPVFWVMRDLLWPVLWMQAWAANGYEWRGNVVALRPRTRTPHVQPAGRLRPFLPHWASAERTLSTLAWCDQRRWRTWVSPGRFASPGAAGLEERAEQGGGLALADAAIDLRRVVAGRARKDPWPVLDAAALGVARPEVESPDPREADRLRTHRAGLESDVEVTVDQPGLAEPACRGAQHEHLGMRGGVAQLLDAIAIGRQHPARRVDQHRTDRHLTTGCRSLGLGQGPSHGGHGPRTPRGGR